MTTRTARARRGALAALAGASAAGCAPGAAPLLSQLDRPLAFASALGAPFAEGRSVDVVLVALGAAALAGGLALGRSSGGRASVGPAASALGVALVAQAALGASAWLGAALYALAAALAWRAGEIAPGGSPRRASIRAVGAETAAVALVAASYAAIVGWRLDVRPELDFDELAYLKAVLIAAGSLPETERIGRAYELARFEALPVSLAWQSLWVGLSGPDVLATRLASAAACGLALAAGFAVLRARVGRGVAVLALLFAATAPLVVAYARLGLQVSGSILHGTVAIGAWLVVRERWRVVPAAFLGLVLGGSLFLYQLSWFVPVLGVPALAFAAWRDGGSDARRALGVTVIVAALVGSLGALSLRAELETLWRQTESRRTWQSADARAARANAKAQQRLILTGAGTPDDARAAARGLHADGVDTWIARTDSGAYVLTMIGPDEPRDAIAARAAAQGWRPIAAGGASPFAAVAHALGFLFRDPHLQNPDALIDAPTLRPLVAPLLVVGLLRILRTRRTRSLGLWIACATLVPVLLSGAETRRVVLAAPLLVGVAAAPIGELVSALRAGWPRRVGVALAAALGAVIAASGVYLAFERWDQRIETARTPVRMLELARVLGRLPAGERVLIPRGLLTNAYGGAARLAAGLLAGPDAARRFVPVGAAEIGGEGGLLRAACAETPPFTWVLPDRDEARLRFDGLDRDFEIRRERDGEVELLRVVGRRPGGCGAR